MMKSYISRWRIWGWW